jgi:hypothetical protein
VGVDLREGSVHLGGLVFGGEVAGETQWRVGQELCWRVSLNEKCDLSNCCNYH